ncbi:radical SAM protein [Caldisericum sp. AR60]|uniref:radical SAM protein n=1 Tax=Caldisericum sp. AR60 TaxID=3397852 RepID=UPI0039FCC479
MLKKSRLVKRISYNEEKDILLSNLTGDLVLVNKNVSSLLDKFENPQNEYNFTGKERDIIEKLKNVGCLVDSEIDEMELLRKQFEFYRKNSKSGYAFFVTTSCNFNCKYCYQEKNNLSMSEEMAFKIVEFISSSLVTSNEDSVMVEFTGGEPLLQFPLIEKIINRLEKLSKEKIFNIGLATNGSLLSKEVCSYLGSHNWAWVQVTLDGPEDIHNTLRPYSNGKGSFKDVKEGISNALGFCRKIVIRTNIDKTNESYVTTLWQSLKDEGFCRENVYLSPMLTGAPLQSSKNRKQVCYTPDMGSEKLTRYIDLAHKLGFKTTYYIPRFMYCGILMTRNNLMFYPDGSIFTCWYATSGLKGELMIGNINNNPIFNENKEKLDRWNVLDYEKCRTCDIVSFCGGGCIANALANGKDNLEPECPPYAYRFEEYIRGYVKYKMLGGNKNG